MPVAAEPIKSEPGSGLQGVDLGSGLCTQCGLCCTGALHKAAVLESDEIEGARVLGLPVLDREKPGFSLPCTRLDGAVCTIYACRPRACSRYKCQLLQDLEAGLTGLDTALSYVSIAMELRRAIEAVLPAGMTIPEARDLAMVSLRAEGEAGPEWQGNASLTLRMTAFNLYLDQHFRNSRDGRAFDVTLLG